MPAPVMANEDLVELCLQAIFLQQSANPAIAYSTDLPPDGLELSCDAQQIGQALTNCSRTRRRRSTRASPPRVPPRPVRSI